MIRANPSHPCESVSYVALEGTVASLRAEALAEDVKAPARLDPALGIAPGAGRETRDCRRTYAISLSIRVNSLHLCESVSYFAGNSPQRYRSARRRSGSRERGSGMYSTEGRRCAVCGYSPINWYTSDGISVLTGSPSSRASRTLIG